MLMHCEDVSFSKISRELCNVEKPEYPHCLSERNSVVVE
ncbi:hypothetical protein T4B_4734 [Trichinella pseudospiralis]|uniref:Uncharacterized protein n=1 Tax=Trichinella pseudospiralis TaxID=6337 RepID=A0A0V1GHA5_TRIPS|nr:hypothetical protein T4B_4734 [Trichinella pseudospiralis]